MISMRRSSSILPFRVTAMSIYLVFAVDQLLRANEPEGHRLVIAVWERDCISYTNTRPTLNLPLCALGVSVSDLNITSIERKIIQLFLNALLVLVLFNVYKLFQGQRSMWLHVYSSV